MAEAGEAGLSFTVRNESDDRRAEKGTAAGLGAWVGDAGEGGAGPALPTEARNLEERTGSQIERAGACLTTRGVAGKPPC